MYMLTTATLNGILFVKVRHLLQCKIVAACRVAVYWSVFQNVHGCPRKVLESPSFLKSQKSRYPGIKLKTCFWCFRQDEVIEVEEVSVYDIKDHAYAKFRPSHVIVRVESAQVCLAASF